MNEEALLNITFDRFAHDKLAHRLAEDEFTEIQDGNNFYLVPKPIFLSSTEILYKVFCTLN